ncbi:hypothetical protein MPSEU_000997600 [Mayamaea pseudoterrestris]|nr:hypothetical protein MPSEU_000997600 [Mayamaea pseudoterrestris]
MSLSTSDFLVGPVIGQGSFGRVIYCKHKATNRKVAMKVFDKASLCKQPFLQEQVVQEQVILLKMKGLNHIVDLWASFHDQECLYLVMECLTGGTLLQLIQSHRSRQDWLAMAATYGREILLALQEIHSRNIIHADLSPSNVLLTDRGHVKLCDFGCAIDMATTSTPTSTLQVDHCSDETTSSHEGQQVVMRGTCEYASPETIRGAPAHTLTKATDVWSFGCILYCLAQGASPFHAASEALVVEKVTDYATTNGAKGNLAKSRRRQLLFADSALPLAWQRLIEPMLHPDPNMRMEGHDAKTWHSNLLTNSVWCCVDPDKDIHAPSETPDWLTSLQDDDWVDGNTGWSVFLT